MRSRRIYTERMASRITPGKPYRPSNGTEGDMFRARWCDQCTKDLHAPEDGGCPILTASMVFEVGEEHYPDEWTHGEDGQPRCTAFDPIDPEAS